MLRYGLPFLFLALSANAETVSLQYDDIPRMVKERNLHAQGADLLRQSADAGRGHLVRSYLPKLTANIGSEKFKTGTQAERSEPFGSITAKANLFNGGKDRIEDSIADVKASAASAESDVLLSEEIKKARSNFWLLVSQREIIRLLEEAIEENQKYLTSAQSRIRAGAATETDRIEFEMYKIELDQDLARLKLASQNTERDLAVLFSFPDGTKVQTPHQVDHEHRDDLLTSTFRVEGNPTVSSIVLRGEEANFKASQLNRWWAPSVDVYAGYGLYTFREKEFEEQSERYESVVGIQLTLELFDGFSGYAEKKQKALEAAGLQKESLQTARELHSKIEGSKAELILTHDLIHQSEEALKRSKSYLTRTLDEYRRGVKNSPDVLSASERNFAMKRRFAELRRDYQVARSELLAILGQ